eukprot:TRINITY_DN5696_c0_g2_i7.p1 TRINITY_DN5696_c0_g2~~TRINITY_DN5696_c0_g2_i7.p1  ORF type:complete len:201 (+),score=49.24 TRINITY_DN5696_c0_g2_i7:32-634(+)
MDTDEYDTVSPFRGGPLGGIAKAQMNDNCLLCGFSVSRRSGQGPPEGNVCYQCVSLKGDGAGELWKLPYMMKQHEYSDDMVNETKTRMIKAANSSFNKTDDVVTVMSVFGESFTLSKTAYALREARLNRKMTHLYYNGDTAHIARHILKGDKALHGVLLTETPQPNSIKCLVRLGGTKLSASHHMFLHCLQESFSLGMLN